MSPYAVIDLHCDTLTTGSECPLEDENNAFRLSALPEGVHWAQLFAVFLPDELRGESAVTYYEKQRNRFHGQMKRFRSVVMPCRSGADMERAWSAGKTAAFLSVENGSVLAGDPERVHLLAEDGVRALTLVWNGENELGSGHTTDYGLTETGKRVVRALEAENILVDVSHLNDRGFYDLLEVAEKPFAATHSNARAVCAHPRNLTDDMIREMVRRRCLIGLNYYTRFLSEDGQVPSFDAIYAHIAHFLELGAENCLALGSDYDGAELPECLNTPAKLPAFYEYLLARGLPKDTADGLFWKNAERFLRVNL